MNDFLSEFTPEELEILKAQSGKFSLKGNELHFDDDLPDELLNKLMTASIIFYQEAWAEGNADEHRDIVFLPEKINRNFLELFGLTKEKTTIVLNAPRIIFDDNSAQFLPTHKKYYGALLPIKNKVAYIARYDKQLQFVWDENGDYRITVADEQSSYDEVVKSKTISADCADTDLLMTLASAVEASYLSNCGYIITVYLPNFAKAMSRQFETDTANKEQNLYDLKNDLNKLENIIGVLVEQQKIQAAFKIIDLDQKTRELTFASPYLYSLMDILNKDRITSKTKHNNELDYNIKAVSYLISSKINKARNKMTTQVVCYLIANIFQRGVEEDYKKKPKKRYNDKSAVTKSIKYKDIIKNSPRLQEALKTSAPKRRNQILNRAIFGEDFNKPMKDKTTGKTVIKSTTRLEDYIKEYTDAFNYWKDLEIIVEPVTMNSLDNSITFIHHGINGDYKPRFTIPHIDQQDDIFEDS